jgi:lysozyme
MMPVQKSPIAKGAALSAAGAALAVSLLWHWEGKSYVAEHLSFDPPGVITVCGGITNFDWPWLNIGMKFTEAQCQDAMKDAAQRYAAKVHDCVPSLPTMPPHRQAALTSFAVNLSAARICKSSIAPDLNAGRVRDACNTMLQYVKANGKFLQGLQNRRNDAMWGERPWCLRED